VAIIFSTGAVTSYVAKCGVGPDLPDCVPEAAAFRSWYILNGHQLFSRWENGDVWGSDFRDASFGDSDGGDLERQGGSDIPDLHFFAGHGSCENPPSPTSEDFIIACGNFGKPDATTIGTQSRWGSITGGRLKFLFLDASCPMDLVELANTWFPVFQGLHVATGHSGDVNHDTEDSVDRGDQFGIYTVGGPPGFDVPQLSIGDAWMRTGIIDVQSGCCAVVLAAGADRNDAIDRRDNERVTDNRPDPISNWFAWRWICRG
jgi:hypothetical protein